MGCDAIEVKSNENPAHDDLVPNNLKEWREHAGINTQEELAAVLKTTSATISRIESRGQQPRRALFGRILTYFGKSRSEFYKPTPDKLTPVQLGGRSIPLLNLEQIASLEQGQPFLAAEKRQQMEHVSPDVPLRCFAYRVTGPSMQPRFNPNDLVVFDPDRQPKPERFVIAVVDEVEPIFAQYQERTSNEAGELVFELVRLNGGFRSYRSDRHRIKICGVMLYQQIHDET